MVQVVTRLVRPLVPRMKAAGVVMLVKTGLKRTTLLVALFLPNRIVSTNKALVIPRYNELPGNVLVPPLLWPTSNWPALGRRQVMTFVRAKNTHPLTLLWPTLPPPWAT